jgi:hypothetical protein
MEQQILLENIIDELDFEKVTEFLRLKSRYFKKAEEKNEGFSNDVFSEISKIGEFDFDVFNKVCVFKLKINKELSEKTSKKLQYEKAKEILKGNKVYKAGLFFFYDEKGNFRLSLIYEILDGNKRKYNQYKRFTYFVRKGDHKQKTFILQIGKGSFNSFKDIKEAFSIDKLSNEFYNAFEPKFSFICNSLHKRYEHDSEEIIKDFTLLFVIRIIFLGFIQKKKWLSGNEKFLQDYWNEYKSVSYGENKFYADWLKPLFFNALNNPPGAKNFDKLDIPDKFKSSLEEAPYLNGGLFDEHRHDNRGYILLDKEFEDIFEYIYSYNFTIEENTLYDNELELNPEFLGIIFEKLVNKDQGAVYTPRPEVDFMGRLTLVKWLFKNNTTEIEIRDLYELFFEEIGTKESMIDYQKEGSFSRNQLRNILELLEGIKICDPACGSGAFLVGMLQIIDSVEEKIRLRLGGDDIIDAFARRKRIVFSSLFGVEVKEWAVWIAQLRLWITLFIEAPDSLKESMEPILPSLDFKIRTGDSLVQKVGSQVFSIRKFGDLGASAVRDVEKLISLKRDYYDNRIPGDHPIEMVEKYESKFFAHFLQLDIARISERINQLKLSLNASESQSSLFGAETIELTLDKDDLKKELKDLEAEKKSLDEKLNLINKQRPLIWIIEFADVFADPNKGGFDVVIGNPPYLRQEEISDPYGKIKGYKDILIESIKGDYPKYFADKSKKISKTSDLYTYFYVRSLALLNPNGLLTFICENSWLDVNYGAWLQEFILENAHLDLVVDNQAEKSFKEDVNTIITILEPTLRDDGKDLVKFVNFKKPFEEVVFTEKLLSVENSIENQRGEDNRINVLSRDDLLSGGLEFSDNVLSGSIYKGDKWGSKYLKAPEIYSEILSKGLLIQLSNFAFVRPGCYSGINDFFYVTEDVVDRWKIETEYFSSFIRNSKSINSYVLQDVTKDYVISIPEMKFENLANNIKEYISWGSKQKTRKRQKTDAGIPWNQTASVKTRKYWYSIPKQNLDETNVFLQYVSGDRFYAVYSKQPMTSDRAFHRIFPKNINHSLGLFLSLNSSITMLNAFVLGRQNLGGGALKLEASDAKRLLIPNPELFDNVSIEKIISEMSQYKPVDVFTELGIDISKEIREQQPQPEEYRKLIDKVVFDALELSESERNEVYWSVCEMVQNRINKANSK